MHTPPLRRRITLGGSAVVALVVFGLGSAVYLSVRDGLEDGLADLLAARVEVAANLAEGLEGDALADRLAAVGIPAEVETAAGRRIVAAPATPLVGATGPPTAIPDPRDSHTLTLDDGSSVEVFVTRAGVDTTLRRLLLTTVLGGLVAMVIAYVLLRQVTIRTLSPLDEVVATAERITAGATAERLDPDHATSELGRMAAAFDDMLDTLEQALQRATDEQERTRRFLADAAHQLRTPLAGIRANVELLLQESDPETRDRLIASAVRETARATRLITSLLHLARLDRDDTPTAAPTDLVALCRDEVERAAALAPHLDVQLADGTPSDQVAPVDPNRVREAVSNLVDNARRHAREQVRVSVDGDGAIVTIRVEDDGPGIPAGAERQVFERFSSLDGFGGSGLGLPIARGVAEAHGGELTLEDGAFVLRLPASR